MHSGRTSTGIGFTAASTISAAKPMRARKPGEEIAMTQLSGIPDVRAGTELLMTAWRRTWGNQGIEALLRAEATLLAGMETLTVDWLRRRRESLEDVQRLVTRTRERSGPAELFAAQQECAAQQEWMTAELRRVSADMQGFTSLVHEFATHQMAMTAQSVVPGSGVEEDKTGRTAAKK